MHSKHTYFSYIQYPMRSKYIYSISIQYIKSSTHYYTVDCDEDPGHGHRRECHGGDRGPHRGQQGSIVDGTFDAEGESAGNSNRSFVQ